MIAGQVGVITGNPGWYGKLVQWFTHSKAYHCVIAVSETRCISAETPFVMTRDISHFEGVEWTHVEWADDAHREQTITFALMQLGKPYAYFDIVLLVLARLLRQRTPLVIRERVADRAQWFCSELADAALKYGGVDLFPNRPPQAVTPADFLPDAQG